jgi:DNA-binding NarL/FixJ family response regulator
VLQESLAISSELDIRPLIRRVASIQELIMSHPRRRDSQIAPAYPDGLSSREVEVLRLVAQGKSNPQIADELAISLNTVTRHLNHIFAKTSTNNQTEAALYAARNGLL